MVIVDNFTKVRNDVFLIMCYLTGAEFKIFMWIYRKTVGYDKVSDGISLSQFVESTGVGKTQVVKVIKRLQELKIIKVTNQKNKNGALYFNRYSINEKGLSTLVQKVNKGSTLSEQGVVQKVNKGSSLSEHTKENNTKYNITKEERDNIIGSENVFFSLDENIQLQQIDLFIDYLVENGELNKPVAGKIAISKKLYAKNKEQLQVFEEWYLTKECERLITKYQGKELLRDGDRYEIENIYPYFNTTGYVSDKKLYLMLVECFYMNSDDTKIVGYDSVTELESFINGCLGK